MITYELLDTREGTILGVWHIHDGSPDTSTMDKAMREYSLTKPCKLVILKATAEPTISPIKVKYY